MNILAHSLPSLDTVPRTDALLYLYMADEELTQAGVEALLGGPLEVVQLDAQHCLLTNGQAREQLLGKNREASQMWFGRHAESGRGADFIHGHAIYCATGRIAHFNHLDAVVKPILTNAERAAFRKLATQQSEQEAAVLACSLANPEGCEMCGA